MHPNARHVCSSHMELLHVWFTGEGRSCLHRDEEWWNTPKYAKMQIFIFIFLFFYLDFFLARFLAIIWQIFMLKIAI